MSKEFPEKIYVLTKPFDSRPFTMCAYSDLDEVADGITVAVYELESISKTKVTRDVQLLEKRRK